MPRISVEKVIDPHPATFKKSNVLINKLAPAIKKIHFNLFFHLELTAKAKKTFKCKSIGGKHWSYLQRDIVKKLNF